MEDSAPDSVETLEEDVDMKIVPNAMFPFCSYNNDYSRHNNQNIDGGNDDDDDDGDQVFTPVCSLDQQLIFPNQCQAKCAGQLITRIINASSSASSKSSLSSSGSLAGSSSASSKS